jgi:hypothetical protein
MSIYTNGYWAYRGMYQFIGTTVPMPGSGPGRLNTIKLPDLYKDSIQIYSWTNNEAEVAREMALQLRPYEPLTQTKANNYLTQGGLNRKENPWSLSGKGTPCVMGIPCAPQPMPNKEQIKGFLAYRAMMNWFLYVDTINSDSGGPSANKVYTCPLGNCEEATHQYMFHKLKTGSGAGVKYIDPAAFREKLKDPAFLAPIFPGSGGTIKKVSTPKNPVAKPLGKKNTNKRPLTKLKGKK